MVAVVDVPAAKIPVNEAVVPPIIADPTATFSVVDLFGLVNLMGEFP